MENSPIYYGKNEGPSVVEATWKKSKLGAAALQRGRQRRAELGAPRGWTGGCAAEQPDSRGAEDHAPSHLHSLR